ncbi:hypothetical protein H8959_005573 [Pygathrix nigripes]
MPSAGPPRLTLSSLRGGVLSLPSLCHGCSQDLPGSRLAGKQGVVQGAIGGAWCHSPDRSLSLPHLLHSEDSQEESSQDSSGQDRHSPCHRASILETPEEVQVTWPH